MATTTIIQFKRGTAERWEELNPVLKPGEPGYVINQNRFKIGDGSTPWNQLDYPCNSNNTNNMIDSRVFKVTINENKNHIDALNNATSGVILNTHDVGIVAELITEGKYQYTAYRYNGSTWVAMDGNYNANNVYFDEDIMITTDIGYIKTNNGSGTIPSKGKNLAEVFQSMFVKELDPTKTDPTVSITLTGAGSYEVGTVVTGIRYSASFEDGNYSYGPEPTGATVTSWSVKTSDNKSYTSRSGNLADITITDDINFSVTATASHTAGKVPLTNTGNTCKDNTKQIIAGNKSKTSSTITGYRSFFYGVLATSSVDVPLTSEVIRGQLTNGGAYNASKSFTLTGNDVDNAKRIVIAIPSSSTRSGLSEVILTSAMNTPITNSYVKTSEGVEVEGVNSATSVPYDIYVYEPSKIDAGEIHDIKLA